MRIDARQQQKKRPVREALWRHNAAQRRDAEDVVSDLGRRARVAVLWRQDERDTERWVYLERMSPGSFSMESVKVRTAAAHTGFGFTAPGNGLGGKSATSRK